MSALGGELLPFLMACRDRAASPEAAARMQAIVDEAAALAARASMAGERARLDAEKERMDGYAAGFAAGYREGCDMADGTRGVPELRRGADGVLYCRPYLGRDRVTGKPIRPYRSFPGMAFEEAARAAAEWYEGVSRAAAAGTGRRLDQMLEAFVTDPLRGYAGSTVSTYLSAIRCYVAPTIGAVPYDDLHGYEVAKAYRLMLTDRPGRPAIKRSTLRKVHALLKAAYRTWRADIGRDPMEGVDAPVPEPAAPFALDEADQARLTGALLDAMAGGGTDAWSVSRRTTALAAYLALAQGLRCGEVCALRRRDWRRSMHDLAVRGTVVEHPRLARQPYPKRGSAGNVAMAPEVEEAVDRHLAWQDGWMARRDADAPLVCYAAGGDLARPSDVSRRFKALARALGMPPECVFHTMRHTHATWLLMHGYDPRTVQERLRHRDVATTLRLYGSVLPGRDAEAAGAFAGSLSAGAGAA